MSPSRTNRRRGRLPAVALAILGHLLALLALGWRVPKDPPPLPPDTLPAVEVQLVRPPQRPAPPASASAPGAQARPSPVRPSPAETPAPSASVVAAPPAPQTAGGAADCAPEDLPLLTDAEKARCRNQIDADKERRLARGADERAAKQVAEAERGPRTFRMDGEKEAYYDAVAQAYWLQNHGPPMAGRLPGIGCGGGGGGGSIPLLGGVEVNKDIFAKQNKQEHREPQHRPPHSLKLGPLPCYLLPPQGMLTEESGVDPLDPQWRHKP